MVMQSKLINIAPKASKLAFLWLFFVSSMVISISYYCNSYLGFLFLLIYFPARMLRLTNYELEIDTIKDELILHHRNQLYSAQLIRCRQITFLLTLITIGYAKKVITLPIYIDSIPLNQYKDLRMFLQWN